MINSQIESCSWGYKDESDELKQGSLSVTELSREELMQGRWATGVTLRRSWEHFQGWLTATQEIHTHNDRILVDILREGPIPEAGGMSEEEASQTEEKMVSEMGMSTMKTMDIGWSFLQRLGSPEDISITGPTPIPVEFDLGDYFTRTLDTLGLLNKWCAHRGERFTVICPDSTLNGDMLVLCVVQCETQDMPQLLGL